MVHLKNLPSTEAAPLASLISARGRQVASKSLVESDAFSLLLLAFDAAETISEERYPGDVLYLVLEGRVDVVLPERRCTLEAGQVLEVTAGTLHALEAPGPVKLLQLGLAGA